MVREAREKELALVATENEALRSVRKPCAMWRVWPCYICDICFTVFTVCVCRQQRLAESSAAQQEEHAKATTLESHLEQRHKQASSYDGWCCHHAHVHAS